MIFNLFTNVETLHCNVSTNWQSAESNQFIHQRRDAINRVSTIVWIFVVIPIYLQQKNHAHLFAEVDQFNQINHSSDRISLIKKIKKSPLLISFFRIQYLYKKDKNDQKILKTRVFSNSMHTNV